MIEATSCGGVVVFRGLYCIKTIKIDMRAGYCQKERLKKVKPMKRLH